MAKEVKQLIEELTAWGNESKGTRGVIILAAENIKINEDGATEGDASICVAGRGDLLCHLYEIGITAKDDNNPLRLIHRRVMRKLDLRKAITALADAAVSEVFGDNDKETPSPEASKGDNAAEQGKE